VSPHDVATRGLFVYRTVRPGCALVRTPKGLSTPGNKVAENGNKLLPETETLLPFSKTANCCQMLLEAATLTGAATMLPFQATICCLVWTGLKKQTASSPHGFCFRLNKLM